MRTRIDDMLNSRAISIRHQTVVGLCVTIFGLLLAWEIGDWIVAGNLIQVAFLFVAAAVAVVGLGILRNWRSGVYMFLIWLVFEDLVRKYLGNNMAIFFAKDVLAILIYASMYRALRKHHEKWFRSPFLPAISVFFFWAVLESSTRILRARCMVRWVSKSISSMCPSCLRVMPSFAPTRIFGAF